jgi:hypothetical protein
VRNRVDDIATIKAVDFEELNRRIAEIEQEI